ncbi:hypothetical protein [Devosia faecipullorum]|uniref:hypothetical protein n=1 Tax=Devosia faecipullorum TaxID=2755039 RepID=UPI00187B7157|nr:hypothetical protein [Devosia faecipullorum]MBE7733930.1 hypothetical protein [Devosia faecipullorum]
MSELELAFAGLLTLLGAGAILYAGIARPKAGRAEDAAPVMDGVPTGVDRPASPPGDNGGAA